MPNRTAVPDKPFQRARLLGLGLCSLLVLVACTKEDRPFSEGSGAGAGGAGGSGSGGAKPCETSDPDCECVGDQVVARDVDQDKEGTRLCEAAPGLDCNDGDGMFIQNECGGCNKDLGGKVGDPCQACGVFQCQGDSALQCAAPEPAPRRCMDSTTQVCAGGQWTNDVACGGALPACLNGACVACAPGTFRCDKVAGTDVVVKCLETGSWESSWTSCSSTQVCSAASGTCAGLFHPRDMDFNVPPLLRGAPGAPAAPGLPTQDVLDLAVGIAFG